MAAKTSASAPTATPAVTATSTALPETLTLRDAAGHLRCGRRTLDRLIAQGRFPEPDIRCSAKFIRFSRGVFLNGLEQLKTATVAAE